uniref:uncharacterized protein LOC120346996 n=1 Tax=Styela clava TaxID=7725 RepID=UPI00193AACF7|nr:uncharacterized protein LOC120346996 [Styela clava]
MGKIGVIALLCLLCLIDHDPVIAQTKHKICKTAEDIFDESTLQEIVQAGMNKMMDIVEERILKKLRNQTECGVVYNSKCFRAIFHDKNDVSLSVAKSICGNKLANIYDVTHYKLLQDYLRSIFPAGWSGIGVRTGMTYKNGQLYSTTGQPISLPKTLWHPGLPITHESYPTVIVLITRDSEGKEGILNAHSDNNFLGAICENEL